MFHHALMILRPKAIPLRDPAAPLPSWLRRAIPNAQSGSLEDLALAAGASIGALDALVRRNEMWAGVWRQRLALAASAITTRQSGRVEDEAALRDAILLTRPGDEVGPAGNMFLAWRSLTALPASKLLEPENIAAMLEKLGYAADGEAVSDLADELRQLPATAGTVGTLTGAFALADRYGFGETVGCWLADSLLAQRLDWKHAVPLLGTEVPPGKSSRLRQTEIELTKRLLTAQARAAMRAIDLSAELGRRADHLLSVAPKLRAKASDAVIERLLSRDAIVASERVVGISDRGLRRLFDRLLEFGALRELSGRPTFRIYGL